MSFILAIFFFFVYVIKIMLCTCNEKTWYEVKNKKQLEFFGADGISDKGIEFGQKGSIELDFGRSSVLN